MLLFVTKVLVLDLYLIEKVLDVLDVFQVLWVIELVLVLINMRKYLHLTQTLRKVLDPNPAAETELFFVKMHYNSGNGWNHFGRLLMGSALGFCLKVRSHCVRVRISFSIRFSFRVRRTVYTESEFLSVFDLISCPQLPRQTSKCDFVSGLARFGWKRTSVSVFHGRGTDRNGTDANLMALNRRLIRKLMQSKHCF